MKSNILLTGGKGQLAQEILKINPLIDAPDKDEMDFSLYAQIESYCKGKYYDIIIHAGAVTNKFNEDVDDDYITSNIIGTSNITLWARRHCIRLVYISSDYIYPSEMGDYTEESVLLPVNSYAKSKLGGEMAVQLYDNSLIIRTSFYSTLNFAKACTDQYTSRLPIKEAAASIYFLSCTKELRGIINLGTSSKRSLYDIVHNEFNSNVEPCLRKDIKIPYVIPRDSSLNTIKYYTMIESSKKESKIQSRCRMCESDKLSKYLDLGRTPLANSYLKEEELLQTEYREELAIQLCMECGLSQLTRVVNPDLMFKNYLYVSSTTQTFRDHCSELANATVKIASVQPRDLVLDIASNDGCLLNKFLDVGMNVLGVDPAENLADEANANSIRTLCAYWSKALAKDIVNRFGMPKIITATNVFAHVDDVHEFVEAVKICMAPKGIFVIEFPYVMDFIKKNEFDTAYHEHLSYIGILPISTLMNRHGLQVFNVQYFEELHGGTVRVFMCRNGDYVINQSVIRYVQNEQTFEIQSKTPYDLFAKRIMDNKITLRNMISNLRANGKTIWAYGASAKGNTLMNFFELTQENIPIVIDDNPKKWGYYSPGSHMKIVSIDELTKSEVDFLLLLAWNFQAEIIKRCQDKKYKGDFILPVPEATIIKNIY
ncbi:MAG: sugar nucleotide-binding protein [Bacteroidota bacterium]|nr:sugar nucleotide-binding protein [Bacteroidota bacterium]